MSKSEVKKKYWKLSLLVHPDKCEHPKAQAAFTAVNEAAKTLQDESGRAQLDQRSAGKRPVLFYILTDFSDDFVY
jgi:curved DNA-binding protein CbpA